MQLDGKTAQNQFSRHLKRRVSPSMVAGYIRELFSGFRMGKVTVTYTAKAQGKGKWAGELIVSNG